MSVKTILYLSLCLLVGCGSADFSTEGGSGNSSVTSTSIETDTDTQKKALKDSENVNADFDSGRPLFATKTFKIEKTIETLPIDIIFAVDTSGSMSEEKSLLQSNMAGFINKISETQDADLNLMVVGRDFQFDANTDQKLTRINHPIASTDAFKQLTDLLSESALPIRSESTKHFIIVTDDNARRVLGSDFVKTLDSNEVTANSSKVHGIIGLPDSNQRDGCTVDSIGTEYIEISKHKSYGGMTQDLCSSDWEQLLDVFAEDIVKTSYTTTFTTHLDIDFDRPYRVAINGKRLKPDHFTFEPSTGDLSISDAEAIESTGELTIDYYPER